MCEVRDLKPNGANILVTEENKKEYVHLVCQMKMTGEVWLFIYYNNISHMHHFTIEIDSNVCPYSPADAILNVVVYSKHIVQNVCQ